MLAQLIPAALMLSIFFLVFALGLEASLGDAFFLLRRPGLLLRSLTAMNLVMVVFSIAVSELFKLDPAVKLAILVLAVSPVPPVLPRNSGNAGGDVAYGIGLLVAAVVASIVIVPVSIDLLGRYFGVSAYMPPAKILPIVLITAIVPMLGGMLVHKFKPALATRIAKPLAKAAGIFLIIVLLPVLFTMAPQMWAAVGNGGLIVLVAFTMVGLGVGHLLGGPEPDDRTVLALATCVRHPGIALAIIGLNFPDMKTEVMAIILWHLIIAAIVTIPYKRWRNRVA